MADYLTVFFINGHSFEYAIFPTAPQYHISADVASRRRDSIWCLSNTEFPQPSSFYLRVSCISIMAPSTNVSHRGFSSVDVYCDINNRFSRVCCESFSTWLRLRGWCGTGFQKTDAFWGQSVIFAVYQTDVTHFCSTEINIGNPYTTPPPLLSCFPSSYSVLGLLSDKPLLLLHSLCWGYHRTNFPSSSSSSSHPACLHTSLYI